MKHKALSRLTPEQVLAYQRDGFLILKDVLCGEEIDAFLAHQETRPEALDLELRSHVTDPQWRYLVAHPNVAGAAAQLLGGTPRIVQSMYMPKKAGEHARGIALHQDSHYLPAEPNTLMACWIAMSDTGPDNGGLCVVPGSHLHGLRTTQQSTGDEHHNWRTEHLMRDRAGKEWTQVFYSFEINDIAPDTIRKLEVPKGGGVFFTSMTIHGSFANRSLTQDRLSWAVHYVKEGTWVLRADVQDTVAVAELACNAEPSAPADAEKPRR